MDGTKDDLAWLKPLGSIDANRQTTSPKSHQSNLWSPLYALMDETFGPTRVQDLLPDEENEEDDNVEVKEHAEEDRLTTGIDSQAISCAEDDGQHSYTLTEQDQSRLGMIAQHAPDGHDATSSDDHDGELPARIGSAQRISSGATKTPQREEKHDDHLRSALRLMQKGANAPSAYVSCDQDLTANPPSMTGFPGAPQLWPPQLAAVGRLITMLETNLCALLAFEMGLGKTLIAIAVLVTMGLTTTSQEGPVLIVLPPGLLAQWHRDLTATIHPPPTICIFHDGKLAGRPTSTSHTVEELEQYDVVLTTYNIVRIQYDRMLSTEERIKVWLRKRLPFKFPGRSIFPLFVIRWWLVVLDEAHLVSNPKTKISAAVCALPGLYRLPITGTPLQNEYTDIQGMLAFMRVKPWSDLNLFKQYFFQRRTKNKRGDILKAELAAILANTLRAVCLRLTIKDTFNGVKVATFLPAKDWWVKHDLTTTQIIYQDRTKHIWHEPTRWATDAARKLPHFQPPLGKNETFPAIMGARLSFVHDECPNANYGEIGERDLVDGPGGQTEAEIEDMLMQMADEGFESGAGKKAKKKQKSIRRRNDFKKKMEKNWRSPRMTEMLKIIGKQKAKGKVGKFLIFSEFLCALDVADAALNSQGFKTLRYDGWQSKSENEEAHRVFNIANNDYDFLLVTNRSGGQGLNIQTASTVIHLTPAWNPAMTRQCNARAARHGQQNIVDVFHFVIIDSIEGHIYKLAQTKDRKASELLNPQTGMLAMMKQAAAWPMKYFSNIMVRASLSAAAYGKEIQKRKERKEAAKRAKEEAEEEERAYAAASLLQDNFTAVSFRALEYRMRGSPETPTDSDDGLGDTLGTPPPNENEFIDDGIEVGKEDQDEEDEEDEEESTDTTDNGGSDSELSIWEGGSEGDGQSEDDETVCHHAELWDG